MQNNWLLPIIKNKRSPMIEQEAYLFALFTETYPGPGHRTQETRDKRQEKLREGEEKRYYFTPHLFLLKHSLNARDN